MEEGKKVGRKSSSWEGVVRADSSANRKEVRRNRLTGSVKKKTLLCGGGFPPPTYYYRDYNAMEWGGGGDRGCFVLL